MHKFLSIPVQLQAPGSSEPRDSVIPETFREPSWKGPQQSRYRPLQGEHISKEVDEDQRMDEEQRRHSVSQCHRPSGPAQRYQADSQLIMSYYISKS